MAGKQTQGPLAPKQKLDTETLDTALNPAEPSAMTAQPDALTGGPAGAAVQAQYVQQRGAEVVEHQKREQDTFADKASAAWQESYTGYIVEAVDRAFAQQSANFDPTFDGHRRATELIQRMGIPMTDRALQALASAGTEEDQLALASRLQQHNTNQDILKAHGAYAVASGLLDPATLLTDFATFGASKAFTLGRLASAVAGAAGGASVVAAADAAGKETDPVDYLINAAMGAGAMALFGGQAGVNIANGSGNWFGKLRAGEGLRKAVNEFTSETDMLMHSQAAVDHLRPLLDDPVRRAGYLQNDNGASIQRHYWNEVDGLMQRYDDAVEQHLAQQGGYSWLARKVDASGKYSAAKDDLNAAVADELLRRDAQWTRYGNVLPDPSVDPAIAKLADLSDAAHGRMGEIARDAGVRGFEDFQARPGYFHRSYNFSKFQAMEQAAPGSVKQLLSQSIMSGIKGLDQADADSIAAALAQRVKDKASGTRSDFMGGLGKTDTAFVRESLELAKVSQARIDSIMGKIEQKASDQGTIKYGKHRLSLDMGVSLVGADGKVYKMTDLIDTDLDRVMENYLSSLAGRSALAKAGVGGDDAAIEAYKRGFFDTLSHLPQAKQKELMDQLEGVLGDFTGNRPDRNILGGKAQTAKGLADAVMLAASGLWQVGEYSTIAARHGLVETGKEFVKRFPVVGDVLRAASKDRDLAEELSTVLNIDLGRDVRFKPWKRQFEAMLAANDTVFARILHSGKQAVPYLNAMKFIHSHQARMNANLTLNKFARAAKGDAAALADIKSYAPDLDWPRIQSALQTHVTYQGGGKNASSMNWDAWARADIDHMMNAALRMMDDTLLYGRVAQGASFSRGQVGQVLGQFRSFVSFAHNKLLRGTLENKGAGGLATLLAFQYPLIFMVAGLNEARKGELDLSESGIKDLAKKSLGYTAGLGFVADAAGIVGLTGGRGGLSVPLTGLADAPGFAVKGLQHISEGEAGKGAADIGRAATMVVPFLNVMPGTAMALDALKGDTK